MRSGHGRGGITHIENSQAWAGVRAMIEEMARDNSVQGVLARQRETMAFIAALNRPSVPTPRELRFVK